MDIGENLRAAMLLLADGRQGYDDGELDMQAGGLFGIAADGDAMATRPGHQGELGEDPMGRILRRHLL